jgi:transketolase
MGKGCVTEDGSNFESQCSTHGQPLSGAGASFAKTIKNLGGDPEHPFQVFSEVQEAYSKRSEELIKAAAQKKAEQAKWEAENPELAKKLRKFFSNEVPEFDYSKIEQKAGVATRGASGAVLAEFAKEVDNMIVASADLSNSDKTDGFLKNTKAFTKGDFSGKFLQAGVSELTMGAIMNGIALHGGVIPACGTFFVFSDYMKPVARMAALMELPVKYIWTHDAFRVGEDGPTHQPVEQEAQIRLMEKLQNHSHKNSMLVLRPADGNETTVAWKLAMENTTTPTALILSRQGIKDVTTFETAQQADKGAYIIKDVEGTPDVILLASGSEVSTLADGAELLEKDGIKCRIVSVPSEGLFRTQPAEYQEAVLPKGIKKFGMTAGLPVTLEGLVGADGKVFGMPSFGFSASYKVLDEKLGFNGQNVYNQVKDMLG